MRWLRGRTKQINSRETCFQPCMELRRSTAPIHTLQTTKCRPSKRQEIRSQKQCLHRSEATSQDYFVHPSSVCPSFVRMSKMALIVSSLSAYRSLKNLFPVYLFYVCIFLCHGNRLHNLIQIHRWIDRYQFVRVNK